MMNLEEIENFDKENHKNRESNIEKQLKEQNLLLKELLRLKIKETNAKKRQNWISWIKYGGIIFGILWTLLQAKMFFTNLIESVTPSFENVNMNGNLLNEETQKQFEGILREAGNFFNN